MFSKNKAKRQHPVYKQQKSETFYFNQIRHYFDLKLTKTAIDDRVWNDLDMDEIFMYLDRTITKPGQQYLYYVLRNPSPAVDPKFDQEALITSIHEDQNTRSKLVEALDTIATGGNYQIGHLMDSSKLKRPKWFFLIPSCSIASVILILLSFIYSWASLALTLLLAINFTLHLWNKRNLFPFISTIGDLITLKTGIKKLLKLKPLESNISFPYNAYQDIKKISRNTRFIKVDQSMVGELNQMADFFIELLKATFLIEPLILYRLLNEISDKKESIESLFEFVGLLDVTLSTDAFRGDLSYYCLPDNSKNAPFRFRELYHPLIIECKANSLRGTQSCLITGSNMSGKSTFIKTIGINVIVSRSLNTCCARAFSIPPVKLLTAIKSSDDLIEQVSYYLDEVERIKQMIDESQQPTTGLFLIDEIFKGTNTEERIASGAAVLEYLARKNHVFATTHDLELANLVGDEFALFHFQEDSEGQFDHQLKPGKLESTNAIKWLVRKNYPEEIISKANTLLQNNKF